MVEKLTRESLWLRQATISAAPVAAPSLSVTTVGTAGTTVYSYSASIVDSNGIASPRSPIVTIATGNATLNSTNYNQVAIAAGSLPSTWQKILIFRASNAIASGWIATLTSPTATFNDQGAAVLAGPPPASSLTLLMADGVTTVPGVRYLGSYTTPTLNDVVWYTQNGSDILVLGALA